MPKITISINSGFNSIRSLVLSCFKITIIPPGCYAAVLLFISEKAARENLSAAPQRVLFPGTKAESTSHGSDAEVKTNPLEYVWSKFPAQNGGTDNDS